MAIIEHYDQGTPSYVELITPDQAAAKEFYGGLFGWDMQDIDMGEAGTYTTVAVDGEGIAGMSGQMPGMEGHPAFWGVYLTVEDVDATAARVPELGGTVEAGPFDVMDLGRMASIQDPAGSRVNLWQAGSNIGTSRVNEPGTPIWHELTGPDLPTAERFYADLLGVTWETMPMEGGEAYTCLMVGGRPVGGAFPPPMEGIPPHWDVYFNVTDCDASLARVEKLGGKVMVPAFDVPTVGRLAFVTDPQGGLFAFMQNPPDAT